MDLSRPEGRGDRPQRAGRAGTPCCARRHAVACGACPDGGSGIIPHSPPPAPFTEITVLDDAPAAGAGDGFTSW